MGSENLEEVSISRLKKVESLMLGWSRNYSESDQEKVAIAIDQLKEIAYFLEDPSQLESPTTAKRLKDDLPTLTARLEEIVGSRGYEGLASITTQIQRLYEFYARASQIANENMSLRAKALEAQVKEYELREKNRIKEEQRLQREKSQNTAKEWAAYYESYITLPTDLRKEKKWWHHARDWLNRLVYSGDNFYHLERKWLATRTVWLLMLIAVFAFYIWWALCQMSAVERKDIQILVLNKLIFLPLVVLLSIGFAFASRNYRIHANLLAEYRHRHIVAKVLQNIIIDRAMENDNDQLKTALLNEGAKAMFALKSAGHLSKESSEKSPFSEVLKEMNINIDNRR